jgi:hypothetical protein
VKYNLARCLYVRILLQKTFIIEMKLVIEGTAAELTNFLKHNVVNLEPDAAERPPDAAERHDAPNPDAAERLHQAAEQAERERPYDAAEQATDEGETQASTMYDSDATVTEDETDPDFKFYYCKGVVVNDNMILDCVGTERWKRKLPGYCFGIHGNSTTGLRKSCKNCVQRAKTIRRRMQRRHKPNNY